MKLAQIPARIFWPVMALLFIAPHLVLAGDAHPPATAADWGNDPDSALKTVVASCNAIIQFVAGMATNMTIAEWAWTAFGTVVAIARFVPALQPYTDLAWAFVSGRKAREADKNKDVMAKGFVDVATIMRSFPRDTKLGQVLDKLEARLPTEVTAAYRAWEAEQEVRPGTTNAATELAQLIAAAVTQTAPVNPKTAPTTVQPILPG